MLKPYDSLLGFSQARILNSLLFLPSFLHFCFVFFRKTQNLLRRESNSTLAIYISIIFYHSSFGREQETERSLCLFVLFRSMVFHSLIQNSETPIQQQPPPPPPPPLDATMASSTTVKSQPLHNFSLPDLKWAMNHTNTNRFRKLSDSSHKSPPNDADGDAEYPRQNPLLEGVKIGDAIEKTEKRELKVVSDDVAENLENKQTASSDGSRSKIFIRIRTKNNKIMEEVAYAGDQTSVAEDAEEPVLKTWNLRPRRLLTKVNNHNNNVSGGAPRIGGPALQDNKAQAPTRSELTRSNRNESTDLKAAEKKEKERVKEKKQKFSISLSKEEIEEDFLLLAGSKPPRRPKKRVRNVQKQLDFVFPGLWLASITPDAYRVNDGANKG